jgi:hypothetical protein
MLNCQTGVKVDARIGGKDAWVDNKVTNVRISVQDHVDRRAPTPGLIVYAPMKLMNYAKGCMSMDNCRLLTGGVLEAKGIR